MLKYTTAQVTFREIPDEITLCINISGCPIKCPDCHSKELWKNVGTNLTKEELIKLLQCNPGISCVCLMGGDSDYKSIKNIHLWLTELRKHFGAFKIAWYSGRTLAELLEEVGDFLYMFNYVKVGPYIKEKGGLDNPNTNQRLYKVLYLLDKPQFDDITLKVGMQIEFPD